MGTAEQLRTKFETVISSTNRFDFHSTRQTDIGEGIVVEGMITRAAQNIEDYKAFQKSVTRVDMSVQIKAMDDGEVLRSKNFSVVYGADPAEGTIIKTKSATSIKASGECEDPVVCNNLKMITALRYRCCWMRWRHSLKRHFGQLPRYTMLMEVWSQCLAALIMVLPQRKS